MNRTVPFHLLLFVSGGLALVYEVLWMRRFTAVFGATTPATAATLAAMFVGLTAGSAFFGNRSAHFPRPLRGYGMLEIAAGLSALLVGPLLMLYSKLEPSFYASLSQTPAAFVAVKLLLALVALFLPSFFLGGTVPVLVQALVGTRDQLGPVGSGLYAANTLGAAIGALSVPFFWLPNLGANLSYGICVAVNLLVGATAWVLDRKTSPQEGRPSSPRPSRPSKGGEGEASAVSVTRLAALAALSGALMFILQVAATRLFAQIHENSIYSFAVVVAVFILGLALGAAGARALMRRGWRANRLLRWAWAGAGFAVLFMPYLFLGFTGNLSYYGHSGGWTGYGARIVGVAALTLLLPTFLGGMVLPLLMDQMGRRADASAGKSLGLLLAANTAGVVVGSMLAAFVLPSVLGLWITIAAVGVAMVLACLFTLEEPTSRRTRVVIVVACSFAVAIGMNAPKRPRTKLRADKGETLLAVHEGSHGIVAVVEQPGSRRIKLDNFYVLGGTASVGDERMQAHLPLLLHPQPRHVAFLGLGTGISAGGALLHPVERVTAIEIVPEVIRAAREHFSSENLAIVTSPRAEIIADDARSFLRGARRQFDVIIGDLVVPWRRGESALYSAEHFTAVRRALNTNGLFCQWLPMFQLSEEEFQIVTATFLDVFPRASLWRGDFAPDHPALALIGHANDRAAFDPAAIARRVGEITKDDANPQLVHPAAVWIYLIGPLDPRAAEFVAAKRHRENRPWLELLSPLAHATGKGERPLFVGRALEKHLSDSRYQPPIGSVLSLVTAEHLGWRAAGRELAEATLLMYEGRHAEGQARLRAATLKLPPELQRSFLPESAPVK